MKLIKEKSKQLDVDRKWVEKHIAPYRYNYLDRRTFNKNHADFLSNKIINKKAVIGSVVLAYRTYMQDSEEESPLCLLNGTHFTEGIEIADKTVRISFEYYETHSEEDTAMLFRQFDTDCWPRTLIQIIKPAIRSIGKIHWTTPIAALLLRALKLSGVDLGNSKGERADALKLYTKEGDFLSKLISGSEKRILKTTPVAAAMLTCFNINRSTALTFWTNVRDGLLLQKTDAAYVLRNYLLRVYSKKRDFDEISDIDIYNKCIVAWNSHRNNDGKVKIVIPKVNRDTQLRVKAA
jgi:hypothetical protein